MRETLLAASLLCVVAGNPFPVPENNPEPRRLDCNAVNGALSHLRRLGPPATKFCSSYLHIPYTTTQSITGVTSTVTITTATVTTTTQCAVVRPRGDIRGYDIIRTENYIKARPNGASVINRRTNLLGLEAYAASKISSACSCLSIGPKTTVKTTIVPTPQTTNVIATTTICAPTCGGPGAFCDINNFISQCCPDADGSQGCFFPTGDPNAGQCF